MKMIRELIVMIVGGGRGLSAQDHAFGGPYKRRPRVALRQDEPRDSSTWEYGRKCQRWCAAAENEISPRLTTRRLSLVQRR